MVSGENITILAIGCSNICFGERCRYWGLLYIYGVRTIKRTLLSTQLFCEFKLIFFPFKVKEKYCYIYILFCPIPPSTTVSDREIISKISNDEVI